MEGELRAAASGKEEVVRLDQIVVEASAGTPWKYVALPGYEILSRCADSTTTQYLEALQREQAAREALLPAAYWGQTGAPLTVIWYQEEPAAATTGFAARRPIDVDWAEAGAAVASKNLLRAGAPMTGDGDLFITAANLGTLRGSIKDLTVDPDSELRLKRHAPAYPSWFLEGLLGLYRRHFVEVASSGKAVLVLPASLWISPENTASLTKAFRASRRKKRPLPIPELIPLKELLTVAPAPEDQARWESEVALVARWGLLFGPERQAAFLSFLKEASLQPVNEGLFQQYLKISYAEAEQQLRNYLPEAIEDERRIELPATLGSPLALREADPTEVARILGAWARLEAKVLPILQMEYRDECTARADRLFQREYRKEVHDPRFLAEFGLYALQQADEAKARIALEEAVARGTVRPRAYVELARLRLAAALPSSPRGVGDLAPLHFERITTLLKTAREQMPSFALTYRVWAEALEHAPERLPEDQLALLAQGVSLFPQNAALAVRLAKVYQAHGYKKKAQEVITEARRRVMTPKARRVLAGFTGE